MLAMAIGAVPLKPALPTLPIGIAVGTLATGNVPLLIFEAFVASVEHEVAALLKSAQASRRKAPAADTPVLFPQKV